MVNHISFKGIDSFVPFDPPQVPEQGLLAVLLLEGVRPGPGGGPQVGGARQEGPSQGKQSTLKQHTNLHSQEDIYFDRKILEFGSPIYAVPISKNNHDVS